MTLCSPRSLASTLLALLLAFTIFVPTAFAAARAPSAGFDFLRGSRRDARATAAGRSHLSRRARALLRSRPDPALRARVFGTRAGTPRAESAPAPAEPDYEIAPDGSGGFYQVWIDDGFALPLGGSISETFLQRFDASGNVSAGWPAGGVRVATVPGIEGDPLLEPDGAGGAIVVWDAFQSGTSVPTAQRINSAGTRLWAAAGMPLRSSSGNSYVNDLLPDGSGGAFVTWETDDAMNPITSSIQHIGSTGSLVSGWPADGILLSAQAAGEEDPRLAAAGGGGALVFWLDSRLGGDAIYGQRFNSAGVRAWNTDGTLLADVPIDGEGIGDGAGGLIFAWGAYSIVTSNFNIFVQHYDGTGVPALAPGGVAICANAWAQLSPQLAPDGAGGAVVTWLDDRDGLTYVPLYAQRIDGNGAPHAGTLPNGVVVSALHEPIFYSVMNDGANGGYIFWSSFDDAFQVYHLNLSRISNIGQYPLGWASPGMQVVIGGKPDPLSFSGVLNSSNGVHATWWDARTSQTSRDLWGSSLDNQGGMLWASGGVALKTEIRRQAAPDFTLDGSGLAIRWQDKRSGHWDMFGQAMTGSGTTAGFSTKYTTLSGDHILPRIITDGTGGTLTAWSRWDGFAWDTHLQRTSAGGTPLWFSNGHVILIGSDPGFPQPPGLISDGAGGAILSQATDTGTQNWMSRVDDNGDQMWGSYIVVDRFQPDNLVPDGAHGAIYTFETTAFDSTDMTYYNNIFANRVDDLGSQVWGTGKHVATPGADRFFPVSAADGAGGVYVCWVEGDLSVGPSQLRVQHLDASGAPVSGWAADGVLIRSGVAGRAFPIKAVAGGGGVIVGWWDDRTGTLRAYAQLVDASGAPLWTANGVSLSNAAGDQLLLDLAYGTGGAIAVWMDGRGTSWDLYGQKLNASGAPQWGAGGLKFCGAPDTQGPARIQPDGSGGAYVVWQDARTRPFDQIYAQQVNSAGAVQWTTDGVVPTLASLVSAATADGVARLEWSVAPFARVAIERSEDGVAWSRRASLDADAAGRVLFEDAVEAGARYGWRLALDGGASHAGETWLDIPRGPALALAGARPNPASDRLTISFTLPARGAARIELVDVAGRRVRVREVGSLGPGTHAIDLDGASLAPGVYVLRLTQGGKSVTSRAAVVR